MGKWSIAGDVLSIQNKQAPGCIFIGFGIIGIIMSIIGIGGIIGTIANGFGSITFFCIVLTLMSIVFMYAGFSTQIARFNETILINQAIQKVQFISSKSPDKPYEIDFGNISHLHLLKIAHTRKGGASNRAGGRTYYMYAAFLIARDGAELWLTQYANINALQELAQAFAQFTGIGVEDSTGSGIYIPATAEYDPIPVAHSLHTKGKFILEDYTEDGHTFQIKKAKPNFMTRLIMLVVSLIFLGVPGYILAMVITSAMESGFDVGSIILLSFVSLFCLTFIAIFIFGFFVIRNKDYIIAANPNTVIVKLVFKSKWMSNRFGRTLNIPTREIEYVRTNRGEHGHFYLSLAIKDTFSDLNLTTNILFGAGAFKKSNIVSKHYRKEKVIPLWEIEVWNDPNTSPTVSDLHYMEKTIEKEARIIERDI